MSHPTPSSRVQARLERLPPDGSRALEGALSRAEARARMGRRSVWVRVDFEVGPHGIEAVEIPTRYERCPGLDT